MDVAIATCRNLPEPDPDSHLLLDALAARGLRAAEIPWEDGPPDAPLVVIRSTWNYLHHHAAFVAWADAVGERLANPPAIVRWNTHKRYLLELEAAAIPVVPTLLAPAGAVPDPPWDRVVAKPAIGAGSYLTAILGRGDLPAWLRRADREMLVQPYLPTVETTGERALVWIDGEVTHAVRKKPRFHAESESVDLVPVATDERALAERCMAFAARFGALLYGRIDVIRDGDVLRVMELELVEPSLFLRQDPRATARLADAIRARV